MVLFEQAVGTLPLAKLDRATGAKFIGFLRDRDARGFGESTAANHAAAINALMNVAVKVGKLDRNPFDLSFKIEDAEQATRSQPRSWRSCSALASRVNNRTALKLTTRDWCC